MYDLINISRLEVLLPAMEENATLRSPEEMDYLEVAFLLGGRGGGEGRTLQIIMILQCEMK